MNVINIMKEKEAVNSGVGVLRGDRGRGARRGWKEERGDVIRHISFWSGAAHPITLRI